MIVVVAASNSTSGSGAWYVFRISHLVGSIASIHGSAASIFPPPLSLSLSPSSPLVVPSYPSQGCLDSSSFLLVVLFLPSSPSLVPLLQSPSTLASAIAAAGCDTSIAAGLTAQIAKQLANNGFGFAVISGQPNIALTTACQPFLQLPALNALVKATQQRGAKILLNSAFRSAAQQYMLYSWAQKGQCGITLAALPGTSNHEGGSAIDTSDYNGWKPALQANGFQWLGANDVVHFTYVGAGIKDLRAENMRAFQQLWNKANPTAKITADGVYGPATAAALAKTPCAGF